MNQSRIVSRVLAAWLLTATAAIAQLTTEQKLNDFFYVADSYSLQYGPYEWKKQALGFDLLELRPWIEKVKRTANDLEYAELLVDFTSSLDDAHVSVSFPFNFSGNLGFTLDIYDGKVLIDSINRTRLPVDRYPFQVGDELVSLDGRTAQDWIRQFRKYSIAANSASTDRSAAVRISSRSQSQIPSLTSLPEESVLEIRRQSGEIEFHTVPWLTTGQPSAGFGRQFTAGPRTAQAHPAAFGWITDDSLPPHLEPMRPHLDASVDQARHAVLSFGARSPIFRLPANFVLRFGANPADFFLSGTYTSDGMRIGFIRIPSFSPPSTALALQQFEAEMRFFQANTDGLIVDDMRNPGGSVAFVEGIAQRLHPRVFRILGFEVRATAGWVFNSQARLNAARLTNQEPWVIDLLEQVLAQVKQANQELRGRTGPISLNATGGLELVGHPDAYTKPVMVLVDGFSASAGDMLPAILQDNGRALVVGRRTMGAGGNVVGFTSGSHTEIFFRTTQSLMHRKEPVVTNEFPAAPYIENIGVRPDVELEYMTLENLLNFGQPFVESFTRLMVDHIRASR